MTTPPKAQLWRILGDLILLAFSVGAAYGTTRAALSQKADAATVQKLQLQQDRTAEEVRHLGDRLTRLICWKNPNPACE